MYMNICFIYLHVFIYICVKSYVVKILYWNLSSGVSFLFLSAILKSLLFYIMK